MSVVPRSSGHLAVRRVDVGALMVTMFGIEIYLGGEEGETREVKVHVAGYLVCTQVR